VYADACGGHGVVHFHLLRMEVLWDVHQYRWHWTGTRFWLNPGQKVLLKQM
jgi:hypothetical protein